MPLSVISAIFPSTLTNPRGATLLYSNQKSKISPIRKIISASRLISSSHETNSFSRSRLFFKAGAPRCTSDTKYILLRDVTLLPVYESISHFKITANIDVKTKNSSVKMLCSTVFIRYKMEKDQLSAGLFPDYFE
jgi:hypothetical protein